MKFSTIENFDSFNEQPVEKQKRHTLFFYFVDIMGAKKSKLNKEVLDELTVKTKFRNILFNKLSFLK